MRTRAADLHEFYETVQGRVVQRLLRQHIRRLWPDVKRDRILGVGYAVPLLKPLMHDAERVIALMDVQQGAVYWPPREKNVVALTDMQSWPVETNSVDKIVVLHGAAGYEHLDAVLRESWRVLTGQGSLILIVPNRTGVWARFDNNPFGAGVPWSMGQIRQTLKDYKFMPEQSSRALFVPPASSRLMLSAAPVWEKLGSRFFNALGGVNVVMATKQLYAGTPVTAGTPAAVRKHLAPSPTA